MTDVPRMDGTWVNYYQEEPRILTITYLLKCKTPEEQREAHNELNRLLRQDKLVVVFDDESHYFYEAIYMESDVPDEYNLTTVGTFKLLCPNPYKKAIVTWRSENSIGNSLEVVNALPETITATVSATTNHIEIINKDKRIVLDGAYDAGKTIVVDFSGDEVSITYTGRSILSDLALHSDLENFYINRGDVITGKGVKITEVTWRNEAL